MNPKILAVIPARLNSGRFPGKALVLIGGQPLIQRLHKDVSRSKLIDRLVVATDSDEVFRAVRSFGGEAVKTSKRHRTGSDRTAEVMEKLGGSIIINVQADHLGLSGSFYDRIIKKMLEDRSIEVATIGSRVTEESTLYDPNRVKMIFDSSDNALWFSRYPLPFLQGGGTKENGPATFDFYYHIGVYFFRKAALKKFSSWRRTKLEKAESLEQLRLLENGCKIKVFKTSTKLYSIDTPEDLKNAAKYFVK